MTPSHLNPKDIDSLLSKELMEMNFKDRTDISEEVHGVKNMAVPETEPVRDDALAMLQNHITNCMPPSETTAFDRALSLPKTYVNDDEFRLMFLRSELFDIEASAKRMMTYLDLISGLFGNEVLARPLRSTDFKGKEEKAALRGGLVQLLPYRDRSGRRIMVVLSDIMSQSHIMRVKIFLYLLTVAAECDETQKKGISIIMWPGTDRTIRLPEPEERIVCQKSFSAFPLRVVSCHFCWPETALFHFVRSFFVLVMGRGIRVRVSFHSGERQELSYKLMGFGIPVQLLPTTESGVIKTKNHMQWLKTRRFLEKNAGSDPTTKPGNLLGAIECPALHDVLYERNKPCIFHPGNCLFKGLIEAKKDEHALLTQTGKRDFSWSIVGEVEKLGGRFLTWDRRGFWIQLSDRSEIRLKVATSLRDFNKHARAVGRCQTVSSVCKVSFDDGHGTVQNLKKRRVVVTDDEASQSSGSEGRESGSPLSCLGPCLPSSFKAFGNELHHRGLAFPFPVDDNDRLSMAPRSA